MSKWDVIYAEKVCSLNSCNQAGRKELDFAIWFSTKAAIRYYR